MSEKQQNIKAKLKAVTDAYVADLPQKAANISRLWQSLEADWDVEQARALHVIIHGLAGSAETFGFPQLTQYARDVDVLFKQLAQYRAPDAAQQQRLHSAVMILIDQINSVTQQPE